MFTSNSSWTRPVIPVPSANPAQKVHLRIALHDDGKFQLVLRANVDGFDIYAGPHVMKNLLRSSWHETGKVHIHTPIGRDIGTPQVRPEDFAGKVKLYQGAYIGPDWSYRPKPDSETRRTLLIEKPKDGRPLNCAIWAIERGRFDLVNEVLNECDDSRGLALVAHLATDWTQPNLLAVVSTLSETAWASLSAATRSY